MPVGTCKLCLQVRELRDSHYIPASLYRRIRKIAGTDPVVMTPNLVVATSRQIRDYVFCNDCEQRLNVGGEKYIYSISAEGKNFPMRDMLVHSKPFPLGPYLVYSARRLDVDIQKLAYFAVSMVWRGAVHPWKTIDKQISQPAVSSHMEEMRRFLMGEIPLSPDINILVIVCIDKISQIHVLSPFLVGGLNTDTLFEMLIFGISLRVGINHPDITLNQLCSVHSRDPVVIAANCESGTIQAVGTFHETARHAKNVKDTRIYQRAPSTSSTE